MATKVSLRPQAPTAPYAPPQPAFSPCATCGALVLREVWVMAHTDASGAKAPGHWRALDRPQSPVLPKAHTCYQTKETTS